jgi:hypothetical protein
VEVEHLAADFVCQDCTKGFRVGRTDNRTSHSITDADLRWITGIGPTDEGWEEEITLEHLQPLAHVRSLMPEPEYRDPENTLFGHEGYSIAVAVEGAA